jgi:hypothetical protein
MVDEDPAHDLRRHGKEVRPVLPVDLPLVHEAQIGFVHERGRLKAVPVALEPQLARGDAAQFGVHERHQPIQRARIPAPPIVEQASDVRRRGHRQSLISVVRSTG